MNALSPLTSDEEDNDTPSNSTMNSEESHSAPSTAAKSLPVTPAPQGVQRFSSAALKSPLRLKTASPRGKPPGTPFLPKSQGKQPEAIVPSQSRANSKAPASQTASDSQANESTASARRPRPRPVSLTPDPDVPQVPASQLSQARPFPMAGPSKEAVIDTTPIDIEDSEPSDDDVALPPPAFLSQSTNKLKHSQQDSQLSQMREKMYPKYEIANPSTPTRSKAKPRPSNSPLKHEVISVNSTPANSPGPSHKFSPFTQHTRPEQESGTTLKRKLEDEEEQLQPPKKKAKPKKRRRKSELHWVLDGNVIIAIDDVEFRLHRSSLIKRSTYFKDSVFGGAGEERIDEYVGPKDNRLPLYAIKEDNVTAENFSILLDVIEDPITYLDGSEPTFETVAAVLEVADALSFESYYTWALKIFEKKWPASLDDLTPKPIPYAMDTVILSTKCNVPSIRKRALYELFRTEDLEHGLKNYTHDELAAIDLLRVPRQKLTESWVQEVLFVALEHCDVVPCVAASDPIAHMRSVRKSGILDEYSRDQVCGFKALADFDWKGAGFCDACAEKRTDIYSKRRERIWKDFDGWFKL
ncbi:hypothetical protein BDZ89DRAFT_1073887 [Hymenopellis radicata]|nr:hypothetical protein BDZ89DRAFT_1073887 [Hymenopellis radicata]